MIINKQKQDIIELKDEGFTIKHISEKLNISEREVERVIRDLRQKRNIYNTEHINDKYTVNSEVFDLVRPKTILDPFCGCNSFWKRKYETVSSVICGDSDKKISCDIHCRADELLNVLVLSGASFDLVDIDPYGSPDQLLGPAIQLAKKAVIFTDGAIKTCNRSSAHIDFLREHYGIDKNISYTSFKDYVIPYIIKIAKEEYGKDLILYYHLPWKTGDRAWFLINNEGT